MEPNWQLPHYNTNTTAFLQLTLQLQIFVQKCLKLVFRLYLLVERKKLPRERKLKFRVSLVVEGSQFSALQFDLAVQPSSWL